MNGKRVYWIDIYKAIAVIMVVIGHSTGKFNAYIYQFHVAAFFFISGYVSKMDKDCIGKDLYKRFISLIVPLFTMVIIFGVIIEGLKLTGIYSVFYDKGSEPDILILYKNFIMNGSLIDLLGAAWFVKVLFVTAVLSHILYIISRKNISFFFFLTILAYLFGYYRLKNEYTGTFYRALVAQGYYGIAFVIKNVAVQNERMGGRTNLYILSNLILLYLTTVIMYMMKMYLPTKSVMDLARHEINNIWWSTIAVVNGIVWLCSLSKLMSCVNVGILRKFFDIVGKNTMGVMLLHFSFFKIVSYVFYKLGVIPIEACKNLVPSQEVGSRFWVIYVTVALVGSILVWIVLTRIPVLAQLLGPNKTFVRWDTTVN